MRPSAARLRRAAHPALRVAGRRVVLLDDTYVSGARSQSAAAGLRRAGAASVVVVVLGRVVRPDRVPAHHDFLSRLPPDDPFGAGPGPCARCVQTAAGTE